MPSAAAHCAQIKNSGKTFKIKERRIKYLQDLVEIETFDKDTVDTDQLAALIKEKATTELEFATTMGELRILFPCPAQGCNHAKANGTNPSRNNHKDRQNLQFSRPDMSASGQMGASSVEVSDLFSLETMSFDVMAATDLIDGVPRAPSPDCAGSR
ncbi:hypothetical protein TNCV_3274771 [Trichonephila clavipes]|nr:hypothetical protein TNCV_3274771 [Trichonephila clavipes]